MSAHVPGHVAHPRRPEQMPSGQERLRRQEPARHTIRVMASPPVGVVSEGGSDVTPRAATARTSGSASGVDIRQVVALAAVIAFSFVATWLIATAIERTIGLRGAPDDEDHLDEAQQGMNAYDSEAFATPRSTAALTGTPADPAVAGVADLRLVSAVLDGGAMDGPSLTDALLDAGAQRVLSSDAHAFTSQSRPQVVRGERRQRQPTPLTRLEVLVGHDHVAAVTEALRAGAGGPVHVIVQVVSDDVT